MIFLACLIFSDILQDLHHLNPGGPSLVVWHNDLVGVKIDNVPEHVHVLQVAVIGRDGFVSPQLEVGVPGLVHEHVGQHRVIRLGVRQRGQGHLQDTQGLVVVKHLSNKIVQPCPQSTIPKYQNQGTGAVTRITWATHPTITFNHEGVL